MGVATRRKLGIQRAPKQAIQVPTREGPRGVRAKIRGGQEGFSL